VYSKGEDGSPIIAINTALNHKLQERLSEIVFLFIESREDRANSLQAVINAKSSSLPNKFKVSVISAEFAPTLDNMLTSLEKQDKGLAPTFAFIDPFGFSGLPMKLIARLLANDKTEVLITFMGGFVTRFTDDLRANALDELFGTDQWRKADYINDPDERAKFFVDLYSSQLKKVGKVEYTLTFAMRDSSNRHLYHLVFGTKSMKGLEVMKEAILCLVCCSNLSTIFPIRDGYIRESESSPLLKIEGSCIFSNASSSAASTC
ncbi:MAG: three-Cys-motif partner protein TcmP, partial [Thermoproteota archaeon]